MSAFPPPFPTANYYAVIMAGGNGERLWPLSTNERPKQFVDIFGNKPLIRHAVDRLAGLIPPERILVITAQRLVPLTRKALPMVPRANIIGEPCRRDTAAAVAVATGIVHRLGGPKAIGCILTADQLMTPESAFRHTLADALQMAAESDAIITLGIVPTCPATSYGYIECGTPAIPSTPLKTPFYTVRRFVEKPNLPTAKQYLKKKNFRWNAGMFIWRAEVMKAAFQAVAPDFSPLIEAVIAAKRTTSVLQRLYPTLRAISVDFAVMEKANNILVGESAFTWDDVGSWTSLAAHFPQDLTGNTCIGTVNILESSANILVNVTDEKEKPPHRLAILGLTDIVVVHTPTATLVCPRAAATRLRELVRTL